MKLQCRHCRKEIVPPYFKENGIIQMFCRDCIKRSVSMRAFAIPAYATVNQVENVINRKETSFRSSASRAKGVVYILGRNEMRIVNEYLEVYPNIIYIPMELKK